MFRRIKSIEYSAHGYWLFPPGFLTPIFIADEDSSREIVGNLTGTDSIPHLGNGESVNGNADNGEDEEEVHL